MQLVVLCELYSGKVLAPMHLHLHLQMLPLLGQNIQFCSLHTDYYRCFGCRNHLGETDAFTLLLNVGQVCLRPPPKVVLVIGF